MTWFMLMIELIKRFDRRQSGNEFELLCSVRQTTSVDEYIDEFVELVIQVPDLSIAQYLPILCMACMGYSSSSAIS